MPKVRYPYPVHTFLKWTTDPTQPYKYYTNGSPYYWIGSDDPVHRMYPIMVYADDAMINHKERGELLVMRPFKRARVADLTVWTAANHKILTYCWRGIHEWMKLEKYLEYLTGYGRGGRTTGTVEERDNVAKQMNLWRRRLYNLGIGVVEYEAQLIEATQKGAADFNCGGTIYPAGWEHSFFKNRNTMMATGGRD